MKHRILGSGAIACSAVAVAQWVPSLGAQFPGSVCQKEPGPEPANSTAGLAAASQKCASNPLLSLMESLPEQFNLQWSQNRSRQLPGSVERNYKQLIEQAQTLAGQNQVAEAIVLMNAIPQNSRYFEMAYQMQETWSQEILHEATHRYQQADLTTALKLLNAIPDTSSQHPQIVQLKQQWQQDAAQMQRAIAASKAGSWQQVIQQLEAFQGTPLFQSLPVQELLQLAMVKVLEPDPAMLQIASRMDSAAFSAAPLPPPAAYPIASSAIAPPPPPPPAASPDLGIEVEQVLNSPAEPIAAAKSPSRANQPITLLNGTLVSARRSSLSPVVAAAINTIGRTIAAPELMAQK